MDSFEFNKIAGAVLGTALGVMALSIVSEIIFAPAEAEHPGMAVAGGETAGGETTTAAGGETATTGGETATDVAPIAVRLASADAAAGEASAKKCAACHTFGQGQPAKVGPGLWAVVGGPAGHMEGFRYSKAMLDKKTAGLTWSFDNLDHFLTSPKAFVPGTVMGFAGIKKADERANVIAYLRTLSDSPVPLPAPDAAAAPAPAPPAEPAPAPAPPPDQAPAPAPETPAPAAPAP